LLADFSFMPAQLARMGWLVAIHASVVEVASRRRNTARLSNPSQSRERQGQRHFGHLSSGREIS